METLWTIIIGWILNAIESMVHMHAEASEYCQFEFFNASCNPGQVVFMDEARYGRLQLGRCVTRDYGFLGCSANVLDILDRHCSGRRWCEFGVPGLRDLVQPCPKDLTSYLEASYHCIPVVDLMSTRCNSTVALSNLTSIGGSSSSSSSSSSSGGIYSLATAITSSRHRPPAAIAFISSLHGWDHDMTLTSFSASCPLYVSAHPGQAINFTLYSFGYYLDRSIDAGSSSSSGGRNSGGGGDAPRGLLFCPAHAFITDAQRSQGYALCPWRQRERNLFVSRNHLVALHFTQQYRKMPNARKGTFILKMEAVGCPDVQSPDSGAWVERYEDRMIIRCNHSQQTWHLTCKHTRWIGTVENCTEVAPMSSRERISLEKVKVEIGLVVAVVIGVVLGVVFGLSLLIGLLFYVHRRRKFGKKTKRLLDELDSKEESHRRGLIQRPYYGCQEYSDREGVCLSRSCSSDPRAGLGGHGGSGRGRQHSCTAEYTQMIELRYRAPSIFEALTPVNELPEVQPETPPTLSPTSGVQPETEKVSGAEGGSDFTTIGRLRAGMTGAVTRCRYVPLPIINPTLPNDKDLKLDLDTPILSHPDLIGLNISADNSRQVAQYEPENNPLECTTKQ